MTTALSTNPAAVPVPDSNPIVTDLPSTVKPVAIPLLALDQVPPLDIGSFPNPPPGPNRPPPCTIPNVIHLLSCYGISVRYNVIKKKLIITLPGYLGCIDNFDNTAYAHLVSLLVLNQIPTGTLPGVVDAIADRCQYNPVADWITVRPWDGTDRLEAVYATLQQRADFPDSLKRLLMRKWLLSGVAAALKSAGFRSRGVLTLQGPQSIGKTAWTQSLVPDPALCQQVIKVDHHMDAHNKDSLLSAITHWIVEIGELDSSLKKDVAKLKGFLSADQDKVRRPYAKVDSEYPRRVVFCATVNDGNFLVDSTGNTRFWTIPLVSVDYQHGIDMQQVFAQLAAEFERGEQWWLTPEEEALLEEHNNDHRAVSALRERLLEALDLDRRDEHGLSAMTSTQVLQRLGIEHPTNPQSRECGSILREHLGEPKKNDGLMKWRVPLQESNVSLD